MRMTLIIRRSPMWTHPFAGVTKGGVTVREHGGKVALGYGVGLPDRQYCCPTQEIGLLSDVAS